MKSRRVRILCTVCAAAVAIGTTVGAVGATMFDIPGATLTEAFGINNQGTIVGRHRRRRGVPRVHRHEVSL